MNGQDRKLVKLGRIYYYQRRVPERFRKLDARDKIRISWRTSAIMLARERRDLMEAADHDYWYGLLGITLMGAEARDPMALKDTVETRYSLARDHAIGHGHEPVSMGIYRAALGDFISRVTGAGMEASEIPGLADHGDRFPRLHDGPPKATPPASISEAHELYFDRIAVRDQVAKSPLQKKRWRQSKARAIERLKDIVGDKAMALITRSDAQRLYAWYADQMRPRCDARAMSAKLANQELGSITKFYREFFAYFGDFERPNPFKGLRFNVRHGLPRPAIDTDWVRERILAPGALDHMSEEARWLVYVLIETGCRTSEAVNLRVEDIRFDTDVPFIRVRSTRSREIKTRSSVRDIPLVGVALEALRQSPEGFPKLRGKSDTVSSTLLRKLRERDLLPSERHVVYSFWHAFERRMLEAGLDYELRCRLMGHATGRPSYGDCGSMRYRREQLLKITHPFDPELFA